MLLFLSHLVFLCALALALVATPRAFPGYLVVVPPERAEHGVDLLAVGTSGLVGGELFLSEEVEPVEATGCEEVGYFFAVFAAVEVEHEFLLREDVVGVEGAARFLLLLLLGEHRGQFG